MKKLLILLFCICVIFASSGLSETGSFSNAASQTHFSNPFKKIGGWFKRLFRKNKPVACSTANVDRLNLNRPETPTLYLDDQTLVPEGAGVLEVSTEASDPDDNILIYVYKTSGGRIIGEGPKVLWDLSEAAPGLHRITAGVDDGCGVCGRTITFQVAVTQSDEPQKKVVVCPGAGIKANVNSVSVGEMIAFHASFGNPADLGRPLVWKINSGEIVSGQSTDTLFVIATPAGGEKTINASFNFTDEAAACEYSMWRGVNIIEP